MTQDVGNKTLIRRRLRDLLSRMSEEDRHARSLAACNLLAESPEFAQARVVMLFLSTAQEPDTASLALRCWQTGKTVAVPKVSWDQRRMLPVEISGLHADGMITAGAGVREPLAGNPVPLNLIDLVIVPGLGFTDGGHRIGRGIGFYDRFLAQEEFAGLSCGLAFEAQVVADLPVLDHDVPLGMLVTDWGIRRFATQGIRRLSGD